MFDKAGRPLKYRRAPVAWNGDPIRRALTVGVSPEVFKWIDGEARRLNLPISTHVGILLRGLFDSRGIK
jgi:hypothetical protein